MRRSGSGYRNWKKEKNSEKSKRRNMEKIQKIQELAENIKPGSSELSRTPFLKNIIPRKFQVSENTQTSTACWTTSLKNVLRVEKTCHELEKYTLSSKNASNWNITMKKEPRFDCASIRAVENVHTTEYNRDCPCHSGAQRYISHLTLGTRQRLQSRNRLVTSASP